MKDEPIATIIITMLKKSITRLYVASLIVLVLFIISLIDSFYQRHIIADMLKDYQRVEVVTEAYDVDQNSKDNGTNNFITGNNNEVSK